MEGRFIFICVSLAATCIGAFSLVPIIPDRIRQMSSLSEKTDDRNDLTGNDANSPSTSGKDGYDKQSFTTQKAPILITIGPPCSGKTEASRSFLLADGYDPDDIFDGDVALKDQSNVYHKVPVVSFLFPTSQLKSSIGNKLLHSGSTVKERLLDPSYDKTDQEIRHVLLRIAGRLTPQEFAENIRRQALEAGDTVKFFKKRRIAVGEDLIQATEAVHLQAVSEVICRVTFQVPKDDDSDDNEQGELPYHEMENTTQLVVADTDTEVLGEDEGDHSSDIQNTTNVTLPQVELLSAKDLIKTPYIDMFVPQAIFRGGIDRAKRSFYELAEHAPIDQPISWGNTNTRPIEYVKALKAAEKFGRPVRFVAWGQRLPKVSRQELLRRNTARFRNNGRYIPAGAIAASLGRIEKLMKKAREEAEKHNINHVGGEVDVKDENEDAEAQTIDAALASLAGFRMTIEGYVKQEGKPKF